MRIGFIGLGKMGSRMVENLLEKGVEVVIYARKKETMEFLAEKGAIATNSYKEFSENLPWKKTIFLMVTHGKPVDEVIFSLKPLLRADDIIIDGGNSFYKDSIKRSSDLSKQGIKFLDAGISGGLDGARYGASIMVGGEKETFTEVENVFEILAVPKGYAYLGKSGAGHFAKMIHNGIEYSFLQSLGEGYAMLEKSKYNYDLKEVTKVYQNGSVIRSWLIDLLARAFEKDSKLKSYSGKIGGGDTGNWTFKVAKELKIKMPGLKAAIKERKISLKKPDFSGKIVAALRYEFGGHEEPK